MSGDGTLLSVRDVTVRFDTDDGAVHAVDRCPFDLRRGRGPGDRRRVGLRQERHDDVAARPAAADRDASRARRASTAASTSIGAPESELRRIRGREISFVFQDPMTSLNPVFTVERQVGEVLRRHLGMSKAEARERTIELLDLVGIPSPERRVDEYPHQLSGGMRQRVMIAMAIACEPKVLIADEPTTALDVTIQAAVLDVLRELRERLGMAIVLITHDLGVVADIADRVVIMYAGQKVEEAPVSELFAHPQHPYTIGLLGAAPRTADAVLPAHGNGNGARRPAEPKRKRRRLVEIPGRVPGAARAARPLPVRRPLPAGRRPQPLRGPAARDRPPRAPRRLLPPGRAPDQETPTRVTEPILEVDGLVKHFDAGRGGADRAGASSTPSRTSPCASSRARSSGSSASPAAGSRPSATASCACSSPRRARSSCAGQDITHLSRREMRPLRREMHMVFQDPYSSLNPRMTNGAIVGEPLRLHGLADGRNGLERPRRGALRPGRARPRAAPPLPARAVRRPAPAHRPRRGR